MELARKWVQQNRFELCGAAEWLLAAFPVPKSVFGEWRGVVDYHGVNEETLVDTYPLPNISHILECQGRRDLWSIIDLKDACGQIPLQKDNRDLTATYTRIGVLRPKCMPQGLENGPVVRQRMMEWVLGDMGEISDRYMMKRVLRSTSARHISLRECSAPRIKQGKQRAGWCVSFRQPRQVTDHQFCSDRARHRFCSDKAGQCVCLCLGQCAGLCSVQGNLVRLFFRTVFVV